MDPLPCPECQTNGTPGSKRVGNRRSACGTCNRFTQTVSRRLASALRLMHPGDVERLRPQIETEVYQAMNLGATP